MMVYTTYVTVQTSIHTFQPPSTIQSLHLHSILKSSTASRFPSRTKSTMDRQSFWLWPSLALVSLENAKVAASDFLFSQFDTVLAPISAYPNQAIAMGDSLSQFVETLRSIAPWAPIPLFAENLRVQRELISAVTARHTVSECLTGCIRDFQRLWNIDYLELFGQSQVQRPPAVASIRHGNVFDLANGALLETAGIIGHHYPLASNPKTANALRETIVYVTFVTPRDPAGHPTKLGDARWLAAVCLSTVEFLSAIVMAGYVVNRGLVIGAGLLACICVSQLHTFALRALIEPIYANQAAVESDRVRTARNGAALDVHVISDSWNSSKISVVCGYSSQLHALTNIPVRTTRPVLLKWLCRSLAVALSIQASLLAAVANASGNERWSSLLWLAFYLIIGLSKLGYHAASSPEEILEKQPASVHITKPMHFSGRRAALVFISMLPVTAKVNRWSWWDVYMPDNDRRKALHAELEGTHLFKDATEWKGKEELSPSKDAQGSNLPTYTKDAFKEALEMINSEPCAEHVEKYLKEVFPDETNVSSRVPV